MLRSFFRKKKPAAVQAQDSLSRAETFLLSLFLKPRLRSTIVGPGWGDIWASQLGERPEDVIKKLDSQGLLKQTGIAGKLSVTFRVPELAGLCKSQNLAARGKKAELISRLVEGGDPSMLAKLVSASDALECTGKGRTIGEAFKAEADDARARAELGVLASLRNRNFSEACRLVFEFEAMQPWPRRIGVDWSQTDYSRELGMLEEIFRQPAGQEEELLAAAQALLWGTSPTAFLPKRSGPRRKRTPEEKAAELEESKNARGTAQRETLRSYMANRDALVGVSILAAQSSCEYCKSMEGDYTFENVPVLPHEGCTHPMGCRCTYLPMTVLSEPISRR